MDVPRPPEVAAKRRRVRWIGGLALILVVIATTVGLSRLRPAAPIVDESTLWIEAVKRGTMLRQVRGPGVFVPNDTRWIPATTEGRVERIVIQAGATVEPSSVILELSNPQVEQEALAADLALKAARAQFDGLKVSLQQNLLSQRAAAAAIDAEYAQARMQSEVDEALAKRGLVSELTVKQSLVRSTSLETRQQLEHERLSNSERSIAASLDVQQAEVDQRATVASLRRREADALKVRAGVAGVLQLVPVEVGQRVAPGANLARVADPSALKAELRIAETQVKDIAIGQAAAIDTRNGVVRGHVARIDPAAQNGTVIVDVMLDEPLPRGARPDMSVEGTVELERLDDILFVGRPAFGQEQSTVTLFKVDAEGGTAARIPVGLGRSSVSTIEVLKGLSEGDRVVLSDMSAWEGYDRVRLR